jgi:putative ABC transport system ATP-binding protein
MTPVFAAQGLARHYRSNGQTVPAVNGVDLTVERGEYVVIVGPSGCGKSTLLHLLGGIDQPTAGTLEILGRPVTALRDRELTSLRLREVGFVFQRFHLLPVLSAKENVMLPLAEAGVPRAARTARATELLAYVGLAGREHHRPTQLSGGEMQRVAIARALANEPTVILADEPTGELDAATGQAILDLFRRLHADGTTLVIVTHDAHLADQATRRVELLDGRVVADQSRDRG